MAQAQKEIAVKETPKPAPIAQVNPEIMEALKDWTMDDMQLPILKLIQSNSEAFKKGIAKLGDFQDPVTGEILGNQVEVVIMGPPKNGAVYFDKKKGSGMICKSMDQVKSINGALCTECPFGVYHSGEWKTGDGGVKEAPKCSKSKEFLAVLRSSLKTGLPYPILLSFIKTSYGIGKSLANKVRSNLTFRQAMYYEFSYVIGSKEKGNNKGDFLIYTIQDGTKLEGEEREVSKRFYEMVKNFDFRSKAQEVQYEQDV